MRRIILPVLFALMASGVVFAGTLSPELITKLNSSTDNELIPITITMNEQADPAQLQTLTTGLDRRATREVVVLYLQNTAQTSQRNILNYLNSAQIQNQVKGVLPIFIVNMIGLKATPAVIHHLVEFAETGDISYDPERYMIADTEFGPVAPGPGFRVDNTDEIAWGVDAVNAPAVWAQGYNGSGVLVGVIDTGVNYNHLDLTTHMWNGGATYPFHGYDFYNNDNNPIDDNSHGTHTAGTVASNGAAGTQAGVAPQATIMAIKVWSGGGNGSTAQMIAGMNFGLAQNCDIISMSGGVSNGGSTSDKQQFRTACNNGLAGGLIFTVAAGNESGTPSPNSCRVPGNVPPPWLNPDQTLIGGVSNVVSCGATNNTNPPTIASFSSHGPCTWATISPWNDYAYNPGMGLLRPDVCSPGVNIKSCLYNNNSGYTLMSGTSMATPHVAGIVALMLSKNIGLTPRQVDSLLETTSLDLGTAGKDNTFGAGFTNALNAVNATPASAPPALDVNLTPSNPPIVVPALGGSFNFTASLVNAGPAQPFTVWARIKNPDGTYTLPTLGPVVVNPAVGVVITVQRTQTIPNTWAPGSYQYIGYANTNFSYPAIDSSLFDWTKSTVPDNGPTVWEAVCYGDLLPGEVAVSAPASYAVVSAFPNPFNPTTTLRFNLPEAGKVVLNVYDVSGRQVAQLVNGLRQAGQHSASFDGSNLSSGIYLYTLAAGQQTATGKMVLVK